MPKKRSRAGFSWKQEIGGVPVWGIGVAAAAILGMLAVPAVVSATTPAAVPYVRPSDAFADPAATPAAIPVVSLIADSYTDGSGMNTGPEWPELTGLDVRFQDLAYGGTGYVATNPAVSGDVTFLTNASKVDSTASVVVFFGSRNDAGRDLGTAPADAFTAARAVAPDATLLVIGPAWVDANVPEDILALRDTLRAAAEAAGATWIDPIDLGWFADNDGTLIGSDGVHPTDAGQQYLADRLRPILEPLVATQ